jgi:hypothetical protein
MCRLREGLLNPALSRGEVRSRTFISKAAGAASMCFSSKGEAYVGQSLDVVRRFTQHLQVHRDIASISFQEASATELNAVEEELIRTTESSGQGSAISSSPRCLL